MDQWIKSFFLENWQQKSVALLTAIVVWVLVNHTITTTRVIPNVPIKVINLPADKTISDLLPTNHLLRRITLTLKGDKEVLQKINPGDLEVVVDASSKDDRWSVEIDKHNLISLNPEIILQQNITKIFHSPLEIRLSKLVTARIPVTILPPNGEAPERFQFLDIWPHNLVHTVSGPEQHTKDLQNKGLFLAFNLNNISQEELEALEPRDNDNQQYQDEVSFTVPEKWKQVLIPFNKGSTEFINDPNAKDLRINFLKKELIPINRNIPIRTFYPLKQGNTINPETSPLADNKDLIQNLHGIKTFITPLYAKNVSRIFLEVVRDNLEIAVIASSTTKKKGLQWSVQFINPLKLEEIYVSILSTNYGEANVDTTHPKEREIYLRNRFRNYMHNFKLYKGKDTPLKLSAKLNNHKIVIKDISVTKKSETK